MYHKPYGTTVHLEPLFNKTQCFPQSQCYWLLPDKHTQIYYPVNASASSKYTISSNGILTIVDIQASDNGIYHFFQLENNKWIVSKALLNLHGAPFATLWLEYWPNVIEFCVFSTLKSICFLFDIGRRWSCSYVG